MWANYVSLSRDVATSKPEASWNFFKCGSYAKRTEDQISWLVWLLANTYKSHALNKIIYPSTPVEEDQNGEWEGWVRERKGQATFSFGFCLLPKFIYDTSSNTLSASEMWVPFKAEEEELRHWCRKREDGYKGLNGGKNRPSSKERDVGVPE